MSSVTSKGVTRVAAFFQSPRWYRFRFHYLTLQFAGKLAWKIVRFVILFGLSYIILYPFLIKIINAFKDASDFSDPTVRFIPKNFTFVNILQVVQNMDYFNALKNTAFISILTALFQTAVSAFVGYGFARFKFKLNKPLFFFVILSLIVPPQTVIIPLFLRFRFFVGFVNLINTPLPIFILALTGFGIKNALYIFLFRQFFRNMPKELEEASYLDGGGAFTTFFRVMLPSASSVMLIVFMLSFSWQWTDTLYSSLFLTDFPVLANTAATVSTLVQSPILASNYVSIASILAILPLAVLYIIAQRFFIQSIAQTGLVG